MWISKSLFFENEISFADQSILFFLSLALLLLAIANAYSSPM